MMLNLKSLIIGVMLIVSVGCAQEANDETQEKQTVQTGELEEQKTQEQKSTRENTALTVLAKKQAGITGQVKVKAEFTQRSPQVARPSAIAMTDAITVNQQQYFFTSPLPAVDREKYPHSRENSVKLVDEQPVSTFSIDVDTASYSNVRRLLNQGRLPQYDAVRVEELINYFSYDYPKLEQSSKHPFSVYTEVAPSPFNTGKHLLHIGIQGKVFEQAQRPASNLVFLIDVSGSMRSQNKIALLKNALKMLTKQLGKNDRVAIVVYAGAAGTVLSPTQGDNYHAIVSALEKLSAGGSTNGGAGIQAAYNLAEQSFIKGGINRVILATDGDFNLGTVNQQALKNLIERKRETGIALSVLGFGIGNYNDALMQALAQNGNGNAYYIDTLNEARKVLVEELSATLMIIAKDVKIQLEFNPNLVSEYRLIGYETRALNREDFNNDKIDAGEIGAGHTVTALYEISFVGAQNNMIDALRYQKPIESQSLSAKTSHDQQHSELAFLRLRYKLPEQNNSQLIETPIMVASTKNDLAASSDNFRFSAAVAGFGQLLRGGLNLSNMSLEQVIELAQGAKGDDNYGYRGEFITLVKLSDALSLEESSH